MCHIENGRSMLMSKNDYYVRNHIGFLLVAVLSVVCSLTTVTVTSAAGETGKVHINALDGIPEDFAIVYGTGATHAGWGRTTYSISADGKVLYEKTKGSQIKGSRVQEQYRLTKEELQLIIKIIQDNGFFGLDKHYSNRKVHDGWSSYISVTVDKKTHSVGVMNTHKKEFDEIAGMIRNIVDKKRLAMPSDVNSGHQ